jgi:hypothetical protein
MSCHLYDSFVHQKNKTFYQFSRSINPYNHTDSIGYKTFAALNFAFLNAIPGFVKSITNF